MECHGARQSREAPLVEEASGAVWDQWAEEVR